MKSKVMNRPMFLDVENVGIMQGFKDDDMAPEDSYETGQMIDRTPGSPEILMNNLRGDMRSIDARLDELAQLVGEDVAMDTPPEVLALLQPVLAQQEGIASLPAGMPPMDPSMMPPSPMEAALPAPDMGMMPPDAGMMPPMDPSMMPPGAPPMMPPPDAGMMPQGPMPTAQAPLQMAQGGYVQRFRDGSDEEGVTPVQSTPPAPPNSARALLDAIAQERDPEAFRRTFEEQLPVYQEIMGSGDRSMTQAQILFDIAQAGLNLASGTDAQGRPMRGSFASRLAGASQALPERIGQRVGQMQQQEQGVRLAALKSAQDETTTQRNLETKLMTDFAMADMAREERAQAAAIDFARQMQLAQVRADLDLRNKTIAAGLKPPESPFGKGNPQWSILTSSGAVERWATGQSTPEEDKLVETAISMAITPEQFERFDLQGNRETVTRPVLLPDYVARAMTARGMDIPEWVTVVSSGTPQADPSGVPDPSVVQPPLNTESARPSETAEETAEETDDPAMRALLAENPPSSGIAAPGTNLNLYRPVGQSFFNLADAATGPINVTQRWLSENSLFLGMFEAGEQITADQFLNAGINTIVQALGVTQRLGIVEKNQILDQIKMLPGFLSVPKAYQQRVVGLDDLFLQVHMDLLRASEDTTLPIAVRREALGDIEQIRRARSLLAAPPRVYSYGDFLRVPPGQPYRDYARTTWGELRWKKGNETPGN